MYLQKMISLPYAESVPNCSGMFKISNLKVYSAPLCPAEITGVTGKKKSYSGPPKEMNAYDAPKVCQDFHIDTCIIIIYDTCIGE